MDIVFDYISVTMFWRIMLFLHFVMAVVLMAGISLQAIAVLMPARHGLGRTSTDAAGRPAPNRET